MNLLTYIWLIFTALFAGLGIAHLVASGKSITEFSAEEIEYRKVDVQFVGPTTDVDLNKPLRKFVQDFNKYIKGYNDSSRRGNLFTAFGYFLASATALVSMLIEIKKV